MLHCYILYSTPKKKKKKFKKIAYFTKFVGMQKSEKSCIYHKMFCCFEQKKYCIHFKLSVHEDFGISAVKLSQELGTLLVKSEHLKLFLYCELPPVVVIAAPRRFLLFHSLYFKNFAQRNVLLCSR